MAFNPSWLPSWPSWAPDFETVYRRTIPAQFPQKLYKDEGQAYKDQECFAIGFSTIRKGLWWLMDAYWPWRDDNALFLPLWEAAFGLEPTGTIAERQRRVVASMRNRGTMTLEVVKAVFEWVFGTTDPTKISVAYPTLHDVWAAAICWQKLDWPYDVTRDIYGMCGADREYVWAVGPGGKIYLRFLSGTAMVWEEKTSGTANDLYAVWCENHNAPTSQPRDFAWAVGASGTIREWNGTAWTGPTTDGLTYTRLGVWGSGDWYDTKWRHDRYMFTCGSAGRVSRLDQVGSSWTSWIVLNAAYVWSDVHGLAEDDLWICDSSGSGYVAHWDGASWSGTIVSAGKTWNGIRALSDGSVWVVGNGGEVWRKPAGGAWASVTSNTTENLEAIDGWEDGRLVAVGANGTVIRCLGEDNGEWEVIPSRCWHHMNTVWVDRGSCFLYMAGTDGWVANSPPNDHGFMVNQHIAHIYSTAQDLEPDWGLGWDKCELCQPVQDKWTVGQRWQGQFSTDYIYSGAGCICAYRT